MAYLLFFVYLLLLNWLLIKIPFVKKTELSNGLILLLFAVKIIAGLALGWATHDIPSDYWTLNGDSVNEKKLLLSNPSEYFGVIFRSTYENGYGGFMDALPSYWNDLRITLISKALAWFNFLSNGNYYVNSLFYNFFCFLGHVAFYRLFISVYASKKISILICCFLIPTTLYFSSAIYKDGIVFTALGFLFYAIFQSLQKNRFNAKRNIIIITGLLVLFFVRSYTAILVFPSILLWIIVSKYKLPPFKTFVAGYIVMAALFFCSRYIINEFNPLEAVTKKQEAFFMPEKGVTHIALDTLRPELTSFVKNAPQAVNHSFMRPYLFEMPSKSLLPVIIETFLCHLLLVLFVFRRIKNAADKNKVVVIAGVFFATSLLLFIGYIIPNLGALVRYRSIYLPFLITPLAAAINWEKFKL